MNRRSFASALAGLPFVGWMFGREPCNCVEVEPMSWTADTPGAPGGDCACLGDVSFQSGADFPGGGAGGSISFHAGNDGKEVLRFCPNGDFVYRGRRVETDVELLQAFRAFLASLTYPYQPMFTPIENDGQ
jgi:hypothetical protein